MIEWLLQSGGSMTVALAAAIILATFVSEDAATVAGALLSLEGKLPLTVAFASCFLGIWLGDIGLYWGARRLRSSAVVQRWITRFAPTHAIARAEHWFRTRGAVALVVTRFVPGSRLPTYLTAGLLRMHFSRFAAVTAACGVVWLALMFGGLHFAGRTWFAGASSPQRIGIALLVGAVLYAFGRLLFSERLRIFIRRYRRWEFWPAWLFYPPVALYCVWLGVRYRGFALPTIANLAIPGGGIIGESKTDLLEKLMLVTPRQTARSVYIPCGAAAERMANILSRIDAGEFTLPFVLKPDVAQRGAGFKIIRSREDLASYLRLVSSPLVMQEYAPGPHEIGVFYYRLPAQSCGQIFAITRKIFPVVVGDGANTIRQLIDRDARARLISGTYLQRIGADHSRVLAPGERFKLVEAGNHCQGCIFEDGQDLDSSALAAHVDSISRSLPGFFIGRYDLRYASDEDLHAGRFTIVELNGAASEATNIYDARCSLISAYRTLFAQWGLVYRIGAANRALGYRPENPFEILRTWINYLRVSHSYPLAD